MTAIIYRRFALALTQPAKIRAHAIEKHQRTAGVFSADVSASKVIDEIDSLWALNEGQ